jgi:hypothetical protein
LKARGLKGVEVLVSDNLPERLGDHTIVKRRYCRWIERGVLEDILLSWHAEPIWNG